MRYRIPACLLAICLLLTGCSSWMDGYYVSTEPYQEQGYQEDQGIAKVSTYTQMRDALAEMVENGVQTMTISVEGADLDNVGSNMEKAIRYVTQSNPIGAYAVEDINYELGITGGVHAIALTVTYIHSRAEILRIKQVSGMDAVAAQINLALGQCEDGLVLKVSNYKNTDYAQLIQDYAQERPDQVMEVPQVTANVYPQTGSERVVELKFAYQTSRESLRTMQSYVQPVFSSAALYVIGEDEAAVKFNRLYALLMERNDYRVETSITPAYSLLCHGVGDSRAFATVYAAMCSRAGLECMVISGTKSGEPRFWNIICVDGVYYHVDLLQSHSSGVYSCRSDAQMEGYVWDYSAYPQCGITEETETNETGDA